MSAWTGYAVFLTLLSFKLTDLLLEGEFIVSQSFKILTDKFVLLLNIDETGFG